ncbi:MAG: DinB family protein [Acidimicrobiales bacterium]
MNVPPSLLPGLLTEYGLARSYSVELIEALDHDQIVWRPHDDSSAILWHLGHQAAVNHYLVRNLTAAEPTINRSFDALFDSATPERERGGLPPLEAVLDYRRRVGVSTAAIVDRIQRGEVGAPGQLAVIAAGLLRAVINHEYQHAAWMAEVRSGLTGVPEPRPRSERLELIEGYHVLA